MTNALTKTNAAARGQGSRFARLARRGLAVCMLACVGLGAAHAQGQGRRDDMQPPPPARADRYPSPQIDGREQRMYEQQRDQQREQQQRMMDDQQQRRQQMQEQSSREGRREGRLTPDERRDLRRQINEAGADIYPNARRR